MVVPINTDLLTILRALPSRLASPWVFPNAIGTGSICGREFDRLVFRPALRQAGLTGFRWKDLRHTFASRLATAGVPLYDISKMLGHSTITMTQRYAHLCPNQSFKNAIAVLNQLHR